MNVKWLQKGVESRVRTMGVLEYVKGENLLVFVLKSPLPCAHHEVYGFGGDCAIMYKRTYTEKGLRNTVDAFLEVCLKPYET